jgi:hypothetical protein
MATTKKPGGGLDGKTNVRSQLTNANEFIVKLLVHPKSFSSSDLILNPKLFPSYDYTHICLPYHAPMCCALVASEMERNECFL